MTSEGDDRCDVVWMNAVRVESCLVVKEETIPWGIIFKKSHIFAIFLTFAKLNTVGAMYSLRRVHFSRVGCYCHAVCFVLAAYLYRSSKKGDIIGFLSDLNKASRSQLDDYCIERLKMMSKEHPEQSTRTDPSEKETNKKKVLTVQQMKEK